MILRFFLGLALLASAYILTVSVTAAIVVTGGEAPLTANPGFPPDCPPVKGCVTRPDPLPAGFRIPSTPTLEACGFDVVDGQVDPLGYDFWRPRRLAQHDTCLTSIAYALSEWPKVAAWMSALRFTSDRGVRLIPMSAERSGTVSGRLEGLRRETGLPQIRTTRYRSPSRDDLNGPMRLNVYLDQAGRVRSISLTAERS